MKMNTEKFENLVNDFKKLDLKTIKEKPTYLEIIGKRHLEDVSSRALAFFFDTSKEHGLGDVCLQALLAVYNTKLDKNDRYEEDVLRTLSVKREVSISLINDRQVKQAKQSERGRIDLLIETPTKIILIENKINHSNNNPFEAYWKYINSEEFCSKEKLCILLVKDKTESPDKNFKVITHFEWVKELKKRLPEIWQQADNKYLIFLMDYVYAIDSLNPEKERNKMDKQILKLFKKHHQILIDLEDQKDNVCEFYQNDLENFIKNEDLQKFRWKGPELNNNNYKYLGAYVYTYPYTYSVKRNIEYQISFWLGWNLSSFMLGIELTKGNGRSKKHDEMLDLLQKAGIEHKLIENNGEIYLEVFSLGEKGDIPLDSFAKKTASKLNEVIKKLNLK